MSQNDEIALWAHQFAEHFGVIRTLLERNNLEIDQWEDQQLDDLQHRWDNIHNQPENLYGHESLIKQSRDFKEHIRQKFTKEKIKCLPDLVSHMLTELEYFEKAILNGEYTPSEEMEWWAHEHSENLDFGNCELPVLIKEDSLLSKITGVPRKAEEMKKKSQQLSRQFKSLASQIAGTSGAVPPELYDKLIALKVQHLNGLSDQLNSIGDLPLSEDTKEMLSDMLHHESVEADFAFDRLKKITGFH